MANLSAVWNTLKEKDNKIASLQQKYSDIKKKRMNLGIPGRRTVFNTVTEFEFPCVLGAATPFGMPIRLESLNMANRSIIMSTDGVYSVGRISYEAYFEQEFDDGSKRRDTLYRDLTGLYHFDLGLAVDVGLPTETSFPSPALDFEWNLSTGSNERSYSQDCLNGQSFISRNCLMGGNYKQFEFQRSYYIDGNDMLSYSIKPILGPMPNMFLTSGRGVAVQPVSAKFIIQMVTIGHKILGNGQINPGVAGHF